MNNRPACVLVVDDEACVRDVVAGLLRDAGYEVEAAADASAAVAIVERTEVDAVLTDVGLPGVSGLDLLATLRRCRPALPVLVMTGDPTEVGALCANLFGAIGYLSKPLDVAVLLDQVRSATLR